jgi:hypothetical protein
MSGTGANSVYNTKPIIALCNDADSDFGWKRIAVRGFQFSNGRPFYQREVPGRAYNWYTTGTGT